MDMTGRTIGVFDSGVGGISVLKELLRCLPNERFIYYADSANAPYGIKSLSEVKRLSLEIANFLILDRGVKALVVACNTATSAAINILRQEFSIPVIGMEPALKPAVSLAQEGQVLVMATPMTIREDKFQRLLSRYGDRHKVISLPCPGLVELIEQGEVSGEKLRALLATLFSPLDLTKIEVVVLGCTHYVFVKSEIASFFPENVAVIDGNLGTAKQVRRVLEEQGLLSLKWLDPGQERIEWLTSGSQRELGIMQRYLNIN